MNEVQALTPVNLATLNPPLKITRVTNEAGLSLLQDFFNRVRKEQGGVIGFDIETTPMRDFILRKMRTLQFGNSFEQYVVDLRAFCDAEGTHTAGDVLADEQGKYGVNLGPGLQKVRDVIAPILCSNDFLKVGVMLSFEYMNMYWQLGLRSYHFYDCSMVEKVIYAGALSLKQYGNFSMESMMERYFRVQIDKQYQESFTMDADLDDDQIMYAALDTRFPFSIMRAQTLILKGKTYAQMIANGEPAAALKHIDPLVTGDNLQWIAQIENDAIGAFQDMHVHGERLDQPRWLARVQKSKDKLTELIKYTLDPIFIPYVGVKTDIITEEQILEATNKWKKFNELSDEELALKAEARTVKKAGNIGLYNQLVGEMNGLELARKTEKEVWKTKASEMGKKRTKIKNLAAQCEGDALINYGSDAQLMKIITGMKGLGTVKDLKDDTLEKFSHKAVMKAIQEYHGLQKEIGTYGDQWAQRWVTKPCKEEGWLHPLDGRLHCVFNQYDAETGRSSSEKPNGQNLPQDKEVRECFIADDPDESVRISDCCNADTTDEGGHCFGPTDQYKVWCTKCQNGCTTHAEDYVIVTADMSGAELRIIAELSGDQVWIDAFNANEDVHSVCTHFLYGKIWEDEALPDCKYFKLGPNGLPLHEKCKCPKHNERRNATKAVNFLLAYGGGPSTLAKRLGCSQDEAADIMFRHSQAFAAVWAYLEKSGKDAAVLSKSFDMFGRRRLFPKPTNARAIAYAKQDIEEKLRLDPAVAEKNVETYFFMHGVKPSGDDLWNLTHRQPNSGEVARAYKGLSGSIQRQGKNHAIQGTNATIAKLAMGCGFDKDGVPYLWHTLPKYKAKIIKFVHDELVFQCPARYKEEVKALVKDAFKRAAAAVMTLVVMESEANAETYWSK